MSFGNPMAEKKCETCKKSLMETAKKSKVPPFIYCDFCKAVYAVRNAQQIEHPEYGPVMILELEFFKEGKLPKPKPEPLSAKDVKDMLRTLKDSFGPEQFKGLLTERGNTNLPKRDVKKLNEERLKRIAKEKRKD